MAKFYGPVGYGNSEEVRPGIWEDVIQEFSYFGDILRMSRRIQDGPSVNETLVITNRISIVADAYAYEHFANIRYVKWGGAPWTVTEVEVQRPRLILSLGVIYNGPQVGPGVAP